MGSFVVGMTWGWFESGGGGVCACRVDDLFLQVSTVRDKGKRRRGTRTGPGKVRGTLDGVVGDLES